MTRFHNLQSDLKLLVVANNDDLLTINVGANARTKIGGDTGKLDFLWLHNGVDLSTPRESCVLVDVISALYYYLGPFPSRLGPQIILKFPGLSAVRSETSLGS